MLDLSYLAHFVFSFLTTLGFSIFLNAPINSLAMSGATGAIGWVIFIYLLKTTNNSIFANFIAALAVSLCSEILARKKRHPAILFVIPGIIPLVPGLGMYNTMLYLVQENFDMALATGADTLFVGGAIALGVLIITSLFKTLNMIKFKSK